MDAINISTDLGLQININLFAVQQSIDHIQMSTVWSPTQCGPSKRLFFLPFFFYFPNVESPSNNILILKKIHPIKNREENWRWYVTQFDISTDRILQININLFAVQQSIDHIRIPSHWSTNQCGPSILTFYFTIEQHFNFKKNTSIKKNRERELKMGCGCNQHFHWPWPAN